jgi:hypothetical protein
MHEQGPGVGPHDRGGKEDVFVADLHGDLSSVGNSRMELAES